MKAVIFNVLLTLCAVFALGGCRVAESTPTLTAVVEPSATAASTATATETPEPTATAEPQPTATVTPAPLGTLAAVVPVENLNLRSGPGTTYAILGSYPQNSELFVTARIPGNEWVRVQTADEKTGWMSTGMLELGDSVNTLPWEEVTDSTIVSGRVIDSDGKPVNGATVAVMQRLTDSTLRTDAVSDADGYWYAYIPTESAGMWEVQLVSVACDSWIYDDACNFSGHFLYNYRFIFEPPPISPFLFLFETADQRITGDITNAEGVPVAMRVFAERADGAYVYVLSNTQGQFTLPVGAGSWKVYGMQYNPNLEGESVTVLVEAGTEPEPVHIKAPVPEE